MYYNDADSYYYLYLATKKILPEEILFDKIVYSYGTFAGQFALLIAWFFCGLLLFSILWYKYKKLGCPTFISCLFMMTPGLFYLNGWAHILDKNIFGLLIFMLLLQYHLVLNSKSNNNNIGMIWNMIYLTTVFWISSYLWSGWLFFLAVYLMFNILSVGYQIKADEKTKEEIKTEEDNEISDKFSIDENKKAGTIVVLGSFFALWIYWYMVRSFIGNANYITEMTLSIGNILLVEVLVFFALFFLRFRQLSNDMIAINVVCMTAFLVFPRMVFLLFPLIYIMLYDMILEKLNLYVSIMLLLMFIMMIPFSQFYETDVYADVRNMPNPCISESINFSNCTIISNWDNGHVLQYYFQDNKVKYKAHPNNVNVMLDLLYYKNRTCKDCVYVYRKNDYEKLKYISEN